MSVSLSMNLRESNVNISRNTSDVTANLYIYSDANSFNRNNPPGAITISGTTYNFKASFNKGSGAQHLYSATKTIYHNADGSGSVSASAWYNTGGYYGTIKTSKSLKLTTIPRATQPSVNKSTVMLDGTENVVISTPGASSSFRHTLYYSIGNGWQKIVDGVSSSYTFTPPKELLKQLPTTLARTCSIRCDTYNGSSNIGTKNTSFILKIPDTEHPKITKFTFNEAVPEINEKFGVLCKGLSKLKVLITATAPEGASIKSISSDFDGASYEVSEYTTKTIDGSGSLLIRANVIDSRGMGFGTFRKVDVYDYKPPKIESVKLSPGSNEISISISGSVDAVNNKNTKSLIVKYKELKATEYITRSLDLTDWNFDVSTAIQVDTTITYEIVVELSDKIMTTTSETTTGVPVISRHAGGDGVTIGEEATEKGFVFGGGYDIKIKDDNLEQNLVAIFGNEILTEGNY